MGRVLALVAAGLAVCIGVLLVAVYVSRDEDNLQSDNLLSEAFTRQVTITQDPENGTHGLVRLTDVGRTAATAVLLGDDGEPVNPAEEAQDASGSRRRRGRRGGRRRSKASAAAE